MQNYGSSNNLNNEGRVYELRVHVNDKSFEKIVIHTHYEKKHSESINDEIILRLVLKLNYQDHIPEGVDDEGFMYFVIDPLLLDEKPYRLVWLIPPDQSYLGVMNAFRRPSAKRN